MQHFNGLSLSTFMVISYWLEGMSKEQRVKADNRSNSLGLYK